MTWICPAGHAVDDEFRPVHEACGSGPRHPRVTFYNAITTRTSVDVCYDTADEAFDFMGTYRPYNNTGVSAHWCSRVHCPHGCRTDASGHARPVVQQPLHTMNGDAPVHNGRFRCPQCKTEYIPGRPSASTV